MTALDFEIHTDDCDREAYWCDECLCRENGVDLREALKAMRAKLPYEGSILFLRKLCPDRQENEKLVDFLYVLLRQHVLPGDIEDLMINHVRAEKSQYCNPYLAQYARDLAERLMDPEAPVHEWGPNWTGPNGEPREGS